MQRVDAECVGRETRNLSVCCLRLICAPVCLICVLVTEAHTSINLNKCACEGGQTRQSCSARGMRERERCEKGGSEEEDEEGGEEEVRKERG